MTVKSRMWLRVWEEWSDLGFEPIPEYLKKWGLVLLGTEAQGQGLKKWFPQNWAGENPFCSLFLVHRAWGFCPRNSKWFQATRLLGKKAPGICSHKNKRGSSYLISLPKPQVCGQQSARDVRPEMVKQHRKTWEKVGLVWPGCNFPQPITVLFFMGLGRAWGLVFFVFSHQYWIIGLESREGEVNFCLPLKKKKKKWRERARERASHCQDFETTKVSFKASLGPKCEFFKTLFFSSVSIFELLIFFYTLL